MDPGVEPDTLAVLLVGAMRAALVAVSEDPAGSDRVVAGIVALTAGLLRPDRA